MKHAEGWLQGPRGARIYRQEWLPDEPARSVLLIVHGLGEHSGRYGNVVERLVPLGYAVHAHDHIGHGRSDGARGYVRRYTEYTETVHLLREHAQQRHPGLPLVLLGHSMGGLIASLYLLEHGDGVAGAVISAPAVKVSDTTSGATIAAGKLLSVMLPRMKLLAPVDPAGISRDPEVVQNYIDDPLVYRGKTSARMAAELLRGMERVSEEAEAITVPLLILQASDDTLVDPGGAQLLYDRAGSSDKTIKVYQGLYHELFNEPERDRVLADAEEWLSARV